MTTRTPVGVGVKLSPRGFWFNITLWEATVNIGSLTGVRGDIPATPNFIALTVVGGFLMAVVANGRFWGREAVT